MPTTNERSSSATGKAPFQDAIDLRRRNDVVEMQRRLTDLEQEMERIKARIATLKAQV